MNNIYEKYLNEHLAPIPGIYSNFDCRFLYSIVRESNPKKIIDFAPREGRTTSCIINAILKNLEYDKTLVEYYVFEKDIIFLKEVKKYLLNFVIENNINEYVKFYFNDNIIDAPILDKISNIDFLFVDANHDYILAKWYVDILFKKVKRGGVIHMHDIYFNKNNNGWDDTTFINFHSGHSPHPDYSDLNIMKNLYPTIFSKYYENEDVVTKFEPDIIKDYYIENKDNLEFYNTIDISRKYGMYEDFNCSIYFKIK